MLHWLSAHRFEAVSKGQLVYLVRVLAGRVDERAVHICASAGVVLMVSCIDKAHAVSVLQAQVCPCANEALQRAEHRLCGPQSTALFSA